MAKKTEGRAVGPLIHAEPSQRDLLQGVGVTLDPDAPLRPLMTISSADASPYRTVVLLMTEHHAGPYATELGDWMQATSTLMECMGPLTTIGDSA